MVENLPALQETQVRSLGWEDPLDPGSPLRLGTRRERGRGGANPGGAGRGSEGRVLVAWHWQRVEEGMCRRKPQTESCEVSNLHDLERPESRSPRVQSTWGHSAVSPPVLAEPAGGLLQTSLCGSCSPWSLSAA